MNIGETLKQARSDAKLTQETAAEKIGVSRQTMSNWETGKSYPDIASVITLSDVYGVTLDSLLKGDIALIKHLKESTDVTKSNKQIVATLIALVLFLLSTWFFIVSLGGDIQNFLDIPSWLAIFFPLLFVLTVTRKFKVFWNGLWEAFFPKKEITEELRVQGASLFRLLSKMAAMAAALSVLMSLINMGSNLDFTEAGGIQSLQINLTIALIAPFCSLILIMFVFEPVAYILRCKKAL